MPTPAALEQYDWLGACRRAAEGVRAVLAAAPTSRERLVETGDVGEGGDRTLRIDAEAEEAVFGQLRGLYESGARFTAISEERGRVDFGDPGILVIVDPIDGSLNAKRGLTHHALSIAVADGPTMADVAFGFVWDAGPDETWSAVRGGGARRNGELLDDVPSERRRPDGRLELIALESARPWLMAAQAQALEAAAGRVRAIGAIAISLCQVAAGRVDAMASLGPCRSVDAAAAQLVVRESGGLVGFPWFAEPLAAPLSDLTPCSPVIAARTPDALRIAATLPAPRD
ncbi:unannotated protein [freshwater metagenome]|uniref:Unannotated protein n=1 Tax=freshwater metagenome TaxID=449393 RepID=A0A6J7DTE8_9ZZZZ|nr:hypothetical protein [Actinomycetota bacterium]